jgi:predicted flap endonuclease-1-like 5' DNA nuclease/peptidoglycan hydrolase CwlO-like protein
MPEFTTVTMALLALVLVVGTILGWVLRSDRSAKEKIAINAGWQQQIESQQSEHDRLAKQNKSLMEQISQYQASLKDSTLRAKELSDSLKETFQRRDQLQRQLKDVRSNLEVAVADRDRLQGELRNKSAKETATDQALQQKDAKIQRLGSELANWTSRVSPLVDRYRVRDEEARDLENELAESRAALAEAEAALSRARAGAEQARAAVDEARSEMDTLRAERDATQFELQNARGRIASLEIEIGSEHTRIEPVDAETLPQGLNASNEPHEDTVENAVTGLTDQIDDDDAVPLSSWLPAETGDGGVPIDAPDDDGPWARVPASADGEESDFGGAGHRADGIDVQTPVNSSDGIGSALPVHAGTGSDGPSPPAVAGSPANVDDGVDDLRQIKGVGASIEKTLHDLGFFRFSQIAGMTELDIDRVARQLKGFRSRIYREDWIGQARMLQQQKNDNPS